MKTRNNFTLDDTTMTTLRQLSERDGMSMSEIVENAVAQYAKPGDDVARILLTVYRATSDAITELEAIRDYPEAEGVDYANHLSEEGNALLDMLNRHWEELRQHPAFWEPKIPGVNA